MLSVLLIFYILRGWRSGTILRLFVIWCHKLRVESNFFLTRGPWQVWGLPSENALAQAAVVYQVRFRGGRAQFLGCLELKRDVSWLLLDILLLLLRLLKRWLRGPVGLCKLWLLLLIISILVTATFVIGHTRLKYFLVCAQLLETCLCHYDVFESPYKELVLAWLQEKAENHQNHAALRLQLFAHYSDLYIFQITPAFDQFRDYFIKRPHLTLLCNAFEYFDLFRWHLLR